MSDVDETHDPALQSWVASANDAATDFPLQNLPYGRFRRPGEQAWRVGVAIGDQVLDLLGAGIVASGDIRDLMDGSPQERVALRRRISEGLRQGSPQQTAWEPYVIGQPSVELGLPCEVRDYTDFYVGIHHATAVGRLFRPDEPLLPNYKWVPIGYHGRASTLYASGHGFFRPFGQLRAPDALSPVLQPTRRLDYELELGVVIGRGNPMGYPVAIGQAEDHVFGLTLLNDWSARDVQAWEYQPLGPFLSKNFATTLSPWVVTLEALAPFRRPLVRPPGDPQPLPYLDSPKNRSAGALDIQLEVWLQTQRMRAEGRAGDCMATSNFADAAYWTVAQLVCHHTVNGCALNAGDVFGSGTLSGLLPEQAGSLLELTQGGKRSIALSNGEVRTFLEDGDTVILRGYAQSLGRRRVGFGECRATVMPSVSADA